MNFPANVLLIGSERSQMETRAAVLEHFWHITLSETDSLEPVKPDTDLVVVLDTIPEDQRQQCVDRVRQQDANLLVVKINGYDSGPHAGADATVDAQRGPGALVSAIYELLTERGLRSRAWPIPGESVRLS